MFTGRMYFGREILRHDFEPMYIKAGSNNIAERVAAVQINIPDQRIYKDLADYGKDNPTAFPHVIIEGLESDPAKLHKKPGMLAKGASGIIVQHQKATRGATIGGLTQWRESFTPEMLHEDEYVLVGMRLLGDNDDAEAMFGSDEAWFDHADRAWTMPEPFVILDAASVGLEIPVTLEDKAAIATASVMWPMLNVADAIETTDPTRFKALVLMVYRFETK